MAGGDKPRPFTYAMAIKKSLNCINIVPLETRIESGESRIIVVNDMEIENVVVKLTVTDCDMSSSPGEDLKVIFQQSLDGGKTFINTAHFHGIAEPITHYLFLVAGSKNEFFTSEDIENIPSGNPLLPLVSNVWRIKWDISGGNSFTFYVDIFYN